MGKGFKKKAFGGIKHKTAGPKWSWGIEYTYKHTRRSSGRVM